MAEQQLLRDPGIEPGAEVIAACLGEANSAYIKFVEELNNHNIQSEKH